MRVKLDENITALAAELFTDAGHDLSTVQDEELVGARDTAVMEACRVESRMLVTFDLGFGDIRAYPPGSHEGVLLLRLQDQQPAAVLEVVRRLLLGHQLDELAGCLVVVSEERVRVRRP